MEKNITVSRLSYKTGFSKQQIRNCIHELGIVFSSKRKFTMTQSQEDSIVEFLNFKYILNPARYGKSNVLTKKIKIEIIAVDTENGVDISSKDKNYIFSINPNGSVEVYRQVGGNMVEVDIGNIRIIITERK
jgi:hypothetical protein